MRARVDMKHGVKWIISSDYRGLAGLCRQASCVWVKCQHLCTLRVRHKQTIGLVSWHRRRQVPGQIRCSLCWVNLPEYQKYSVSGWADMTAWIPAEEYTYVRVHSHTLAHRHAVLHTGKHEPARTHTWTHLDWYQHEKADFNDKLV